MGTYTYYTHSLTNALFYAASIEFTVGGWIIKLK